MKYAIVTGGARGLGLGIVNALLEEKVIDKVAVIDRELAPPPAAIAANVNGFAADVEIAPRMKSGGAICNTSSIAGQQASPVLAAYAAAKAGVISYTKSLALQLGPSGIRVNAVAPGLIYTKVWENLGAALGGGDANARATFDAVVRQLVPLGREQTQADIGRTVAWLCSDKAINVTGQVIAVDGGITLGQARIGER